MKTNSPRSALRHHVTGAIERGEKTAIAGQPAAGQAEPYGINEQELAALDHEIYTSNDIASIPKARRGFRVRGGKSFFYFCDAMHHARLLRLKARAALESARE